MVQKLANVLADVRKIALVTFIASILSLLAPSWNMTQTMLGIESRQRVGWWRPIPMGALALLFSAIVPVLYFALYRSPSAFRIPEAVAAAQSGGGGRLRLFRSGGTEG